MQRLKGLVAGSFIGCCVALFMVFSPTMHAPVELVVPIAVMVGTAIFLVVATATGPEDAAADAAWRLAAPDLPPVSERLALEREQASLPGPDRKTDTTEAASHRRRPPRSELSPGSTRESEAK